MAAIITLEDGRSFYGSTLGVGGALCLIAKQVAQVYLPLKQWLEDMSDRCAPFVDFDIRGLVPEHRQVFWCACERAFEQLEQGFGPELLSHENAYAANALDRLLRMHRSTEAGEPPEALNDLSDVKSFDGEPINLGDLWK